jgi:hypothetical protein
VTGDWASFTGVTTSLRADITASRIQIQNEMQIYAFELHPYSLTGASCLHGKRLRSRRLTSHVLPSVPETDVPIVVALWLRALIDFLKELSQLFIECLMLSWDSLVLVATLIDWVLSETGRA